MSLISKGSLSLTLQAIKKLLSFKADKSEVVLRDEVEEMDAIEIATEMGLITPLTAPDGSFYTDEDHAIYVL